MAMDANRWKQIRTLFDELMGLDATARAERLSAVAGVDPELGDALALLVAADARSSGILGAPARPASGGWPDPFGLSGRTIAHFRVREPLGTGGMGVVYRADDTRLGRPVALKLPLPQLQLDSAARQRFLREARSAAALDHPNLCTIHEVGESDDGRLFLAMPLYGGETLRARLDREPMLAMEDGVAIAHQVAQGLACAHEAGIVHRDLKPSNLMVLPDGTVKILDFGLARVRESGLTGTGLTPGTVAYMAPEQVLGQAVDARADLWALGVVLYEMLAGRRPFAGETEIAVARAIVTDPPVRPAALRAELPAALEEVVLRLLAKDPGQRRTSAETAEALGAIRTGGAGATRQGRRRLPSWLRRLFARAAAYSGSAAAGGERRGGSAPNRAPPPRAAGEGLSSVSARRLLVGAGLLIALAALGTYAAFFRRGAARESPALRSVAVLPFTDLSRDPENGYFSVGLADELVNQLTRLRGLDVARTSPLSLPGRNLPLQEIARRLKVDAILEGSVQREGGRLRVEARLISARTGYHLWSDRYDREARDLFTVQDEIARAVASALRVQVAGPAHRRYLPDSAAYDLYVRGRFMSYRGTRNALERAIELYQQAIARDSAFAEAYAAAASAWVDLADGEVAALDALPQAERLAQRALSLDESNAEAHADAGYARMELSYDWTGAERELRRALELSPTSPAAHAWYGQYLVKRGDVRAGIAELQTAGRLEPFSAHYAAGLVYWWWLAGEADSALAADARLQEVAPGFAFPGSLSSNAYRAKGRYAEALALDRAAAIARGVPAWGLVDDLVALGRRAEAEAALRQMMAESSRRYVIPEEIALALLALGRRDEAMAWLERGVDTHSAFATYLPQYPQMRPLLSDPRYQRLLRRLGLEGAAHYRGARPGSGKHAGGNGRG